MKRSFRIAVVAAASAAVIGGSRPVAPDAAVPAITPTSIAGARLGLGAASYKRILGRPYRFEAAKGGDITLPGFQQPSDYTRIVFPRRKVMVYFQGGVDRAIQITTWNSAYRTAAGVGPCAPIARAKAAYGSRLRPNPGNTSHEGVAYSYMLGRSLIFGLDTGHPGAPPASTISAVSLYDGSHAGWNKPGGPLYYASFVNSPPDQIICSRGPA
jgi:hypothetical protein